MSLDNSTQDMVSRRGQFGIAHILGLTLLVAIWAVAFLFLGSYGLVISYAVVAWLLTWLCAGLAAREWSQKGFRRMMALTTTLLVGGSFGLFALLGDLDFAPMTWVATGAIAILIPIQFGGLGGLVSVPILLLLIYVFWSTTFRAWDWLANYTASIDSSNQTPLAVAYGCVTGLLFMPVLFHVAIYRCYIFQGHEGKNDEIQHTVAHCVLHVVILVLGAAAFFGFLRRSLNSSDAPGFAVKMICWGVLSFYAAMLQLGLFPFQVYIP